MTRAGCSHRVWEVRDDEGLPAVAPLAVAQPHPDLPPAHPLLTQPSAAARLYRQAARRPRPCTTQVRLEPRLRTVYPFLGVAFGLRKLVHTWP